MATLFSRLREYVHVPDSLGHGGHKKHGHDDVLSPDELAQLVAETRAALPDAAAVEAQLIQGGEDGLDHRHVCRWLRARGWDPARAARDLAAHAAWRAAFVAGGRVPESQISRELAQDKYFCQGLDSKGRAVAIFIGGRHVPGSDALELKRYYCYCADATHALADAALNPDRQSVTILDVGDFGWKNFDLTGARVLFAMIQEHYVERLAAMYILNAGAALHHLYRLVSPLVDPVTRAKVVFLPADAAAARERLVRDGLGEELLPPSLGGTRPLRPIQEAWAKVDAHAAAAAASGGAAAAAQPAASSPAANDTQQRGQQEGEAAEDGGAEGPGDASVDVPSRPPSPKQPRPVSTAVAAALLAA